MQYLLLKTFAPVLEQFRSLRQHLGLFSMMCMSLFIICRSLFECSMFS